jgi:DNA-binding transcriptional regulator YiaG
VIAHAIALGMPPGEADAQRASLEASYAAGAAFVLPPVPVRDSDRLRAVGQALGLTTQQLASKLGHNERKVRRWLTGKDRIPAKVWRLLDLEPQAERLEI